MRVAIHQSTTGGRPATFDVPKLDALTGIRFLAALFVFVFHYGAGYASRHGAYAPFVNVLRHGFIGVSLFFVLSGYILTYNYRERSATRGWVRQFLVARFARIYPLYILILLIALPLVISKLTWLTALRVLSMTQSWTTPGNEMGNSWVMQAWTLSVELAFYLIFPILIGPVVRLGIARATLLLALVAVGIVVLASPTIAPGTSTHASIGWISLAPIPLFRLPEFLFGMLLCQLSFIAPRFVSLLAGNALATALIAAILCVLSVDSTKYVLALATLLSGLFIVNLTGRVGLISAILSSRLLLRLGGASYALYLCQNPVREWLRLIGSQRAEQFANPLVALVLSIILFTYWESPMRKAILRILRS